MLNVHDINYMKDIKFEFHDCSIFGDRAYISAELKQDLFTRIIGKISAFTVLQYINYINERPIG